jgi:hypothetical protein
MGDPVHMPADRGSSSFRNDSSNIVNQVGHQIIHGGQTTYLFVISKAMYCLQY